jgi:hypothetical protein
VSGIIGAYVDIMLFVSLKSVDFENLLPFFRVGIAQ